MKVIQRLEEIEIDILIILTGILFGVVVYDEGGDRSGDRFCICILNSLFRIAEQLIGTFPIPGEPGKHPEVIACDQGALGGDELP
jgi:hypothetical protein